MNIIDSSAWLEYFADTKNAVHFAKIIENTRELIVPTIIIYEVFKKILQKQNLKKALIITAHMKQGKVIDLNINISMNAVKLGLEYNLPMADSIILATAKHYGATIWTQDADFKGIPGVKYFKKEL